MLSNRTLTGLGLIVVSSLVAPRVGAEDLKNAPLIFDVRINLPLEPEDSTFHDFYINAGYEAGFKKGMFVTVVRLVPVHDPVQNKQQGTLSIGVARLQVIHVERGLTVARLYAEFTDEDRPVLEYEAVMIGDRVDPASMTMEPPNSRKKQQKPERKPGARAETPPEAKTESKPEPKSESKPEPKTDAKTDNKTDTKAESSAKNASPESAGPGMVRVPVPASSTREM